jgi:hypothetical protein
MQCSSLSAVIGRVNATRSSSPIPAHHLLLTAFMYLGILLACLSELNSDLNSLIPYYGGASFLYNPTPGHKEPVVPILPRMAKQLYTTRS